MTQLGPADDNQPSAKESYEDFESRLLRALGPTVSGRALAQALGYPSQDAFRKARQRGRLPIETFENAGSRGRFARTVDIARWQWRLAQDTQSPRIRRAS